MRALRLLAACSIAVPLAAQSPGALAGRGEPSVLTPFHLTWVAPPPLAPGGSLSRERPGADSLGRRAAAAVQARAARRLEEQWRSSVRASLRPTLPVASATVAAAPDTSLRQQAADLFGQYADLGLALNGRLESKVNRTKNERCISSEFFSLASQCKGTFQPLFDFQFDVRTGGVVADRVHLNVDYDSKREFDASNNIQVYYQGKTDELIQKLEVGNVTFQPPASRFITGGIPSGNYGLQAVGQLGPMRFRTIVAQQKGNVTKDRVFTVGDRTVQSLDRELEDYQIEPRRFFFTVDPRRFRDFPNIDLLNGTQLQRLAASLPDSVRPSRIYLYRLLIGGQPPNPNGPQFKLLGDPASRRGQIYELLRESVDYYTDPSLLWVALVRPLNLNNERLVVAYTVRINGRDTTIASTGGTPDFEYTDRDQFASLLWDPQVRPTDAAFDREIRAVYRVGGEDVRRHTVTARIVTGTSGDQEKPLAGTSETWLQLFGLSQSGNNATFDVDNRLFPRTGDPNVTVGGAAGTKILRDNFLIFPSLRPFSRSGLAQPAGNPSSEAIYTTPGEYLYSTQHPQSTFRIRLRYDAEGGGDAGSLMLGATQIRPNSERLTLDGRLLQRDTDYRVDYDLGRVTFLRPDTLFPVARQVTARFEENPLFASAPKSILGFASQFPLDVGEINVMAIAQNQRTTFTRPPLGYEPQSSLLAGVSGTFDFNAAPLSRALQKLPFVQTTAPSRVHLDAEVATSRPQANSAGQAYLESFEGEGGTLVNLSDPAWLNSSQPALGRLLASRLGGASALDLSRAATLAWQNNGLSAAGQTVTFTLQQIDPLVNIIGSGLQQPEQMLWLTLYPLSVGGAYNDATRRYQWQVGNAPLGRRWRSVRTVLNASGTDLSRIENIQFWTLIDTTAAHRQRNPTLVLDFGDVSENAVAIAPTRLVVSRNGATTDSLYSGRTVVGLDSLRSERDAFSRAFNQERDDNGLPGDVVPSLVYTSPDSSGTLRNYPICQRGDVKLNRLGDAKTNCTVRNGRLDEHDIDVDNTLNFVSAQRESERLLRYVVDLSDPKAFTRVGKCEVTQADSTGGGAENNTLCWVFVRLPFDAPYDTIAGGPSIRRVRALRMTVVSGAGQRDEAFTQLPLAQFRLTGASWLKRADRTLAGIAGDRTGNGGVQASTIGTMDRDSTSGLIYDSPPGVNDAPDQIITGLENQRVQINERSMRLTAQQLQPFQRAEAYQRFAEGSRNFMQYRELRVWARGRGNGWGQDGEMNFFVRLGRDADNFYLYRTPVGAGAGQAAWLPEVRVDFNKFFALRAQLQNAFLQSSPDSIACHGADSVLIARSGLPAGVNINRYAACSGGYMVYTVDPNVSAPNLAAVQDLAVGMVRIDSGGLGATRVLPSDTLELWIDDMRLTHVDNTPGYAAQVGLSVTAGDVGTFRAGFSHRDANFRQLNETATYVSDNQFDIGTSLRLDKLLPAGLGYAIPLTVNHSSGANNPLFVSRSDLRGDGIRGLRTPKSGATSVGIALRRTAPMRDSWLAPLVNNLGATANYGSATTRSEYQEGKNRNFNAGLDYNLASQARLRPMPAWMDGAIGALPIWLQNAEWVQALRNAQVRLNPSSVRFSSALARAEDERLAFLKPADALADTGRLVRGQTHVWRNVAGVELRPFDALNARWDFTSTRDLRQYGDSSPTAIVATSERSRLLGMDVGLERERQMNAALGFTPTVAFWMRPRIDLSSAYTMQRDPSSRTLVRDADTTGGYHLPRRVNNTQTITLGANIDLPAALRAYLRDSVITPALVQILQPVDIQASRSLVSAFDGAPFTPGAGYQMGWGGIDHFRAQNGLNATSAGSNAQVTVSTGLRMPLGLSLTTRMQRVNSRNWTRRFDNTQTVIDGEQLTLPDLSLRLTLRPRLLSRVITNLGGSVRYLNTRQSSVVPSELEGAASDVRVSRVTSYPVNGSVTWNVGTGLMTSFGLGATHRLDSLPGSIAESRSRDLNADVSRGIKMPARWNLKNDLRTRVSYQQSSAQSWVQNQGAAGKRSRLADNGREALNINADADVAENLTFSVNGARIITFDNNLNRRFSQIVFTAVLQVSFFAGEIR
ncbi:MAG: cell surface protein SprA [Gemmatimonadota bacterium]|nr:cell surface protein SprA [Gemmatimonadota bacterium]